MDTGKKIADIKKEIIVHGNMILLSKNTLCCGLRKNKE